MAIKKEDNVLDPNQKKRWGFSAGADGQIKVGPQTVEETGGVNTIRTDADDPEAKKNGGGESQPKAKSEDADPRDSLTVAQIKEQLDEKGVDYPSTANKAELLQLLKEQE